MGSSEQSDGVDDRDDAAAARLNAPTDVDSTEGASEPKQDDRFDSPARSTTVTSTTFVLVRDEARWRATQRGVDVEATGASAAKAIAAYCRQIDDR